MPVYLRSLAAVAAVVFGAAPILAGPQPMLLFPQTVRVGALGELLSGACGYHEGEVPSPVDRYTAFTGDIRVTPITNGQRGNPVPLSDAVNKLGWLTIRGGDIIDGLPVYPTGKLPNTEFEIHVPRPEWGTPDQKSLDAQLQREKRYRTARFDQRLDDVESKLHNFFGDRLPPDQQAQLQGVIWGERSDDAIGRMQAADSLKRLENYSAKLTKLAQSPDNVAFFKDASATRNQSTDYGLPPLQNIVQDRVAKLIETFADGDEETRKDCIGDLAALNKRLKSINTETATTSFLAKAKSSAAAAQDLPHQLKVGLTEDMKLVMADYLSDDKEVQASAEMRLASLSSQLARLKGDDAKSFFARVEACRKQAQPLLHAVGRDVDLWLQDVLEKYAWGTEIQQKAAADNLLDLAKGLKRLSSDAGATFVARADKARDALEKLTLPELRDESESRLGIAVNQFVRDKADRGDDAAKKLDQLIESVDRIQSTDGAKFFNDIDRQLQRALDLPNESVQTTALQRLDEVGEAYAWGTGDGVQGARDQLAQLTATVDRLGTDKAKDFFRNIDKRGDDVDQLPELAGAVAERRLAELVEDYSWGSPEAQDAAVNGLAAFQKQLKRFDEKPVADLIDKLDAYQSSVDELDDLAASGFQDHWDAYLQQILWDHIWGTQEDATDADKRLANFKAEFDRSVKQLRTSLRPERGLAVIDGEKVAVALDGRKLALSDSVLAGKSVLVDARELSAEHFGDLVHGLQAARRAGTNFTIQLSEHGETRAADLPNANDLRLLGDSALLDKLPVAAKPAIVDWLKSLAADWVGAKAFRSDRDVELVVDHFDGPGGLVFAKLKGRIEAGEFRGKHLVLMICNVDFLAFRELAELAVNKGGVASVTIPAEALQAPVSPLVVEVLREQQRLTPAVSPSDLMSQASRIVRERLQRCYEAPNTEEALREEFKSSAGDPVKLFQRNGVFKKDMLKDMIPQLKLQESVFIPVVRNETQGWDSLQA